jgi:uncharacterized membrane protein YagU involved in acid resistance
MLNAHRAGSLRTWNRRVRRVEEGNLVDFICGFVFGFLFGLLFVLLAVFMCNVKRMFKNGMIIGIIAKVFFYVMYESNPSGQTSTRSAT